MKAPFRRRAFTSAIAVALVTAMAIPIGAFADTGSSWSFGEGLLGTPVEPSRETVIDVPNLPVSVEETDDEEARDIGRGDLALGSGAFDTAPFDENVSAAPLSSADIVISAGGATTLTLSETTYTLSGAQSGSGILDDDTSLVVDEGVSGALTIQGSGALQSMLLRSSDGARGLECTIDTGANVRVSDRVETMDLNIFGSLDVTSAAVLDVSPESYSAIIDVCGSLYMSGASLTGRAASPAQSAYFLLIRDTLESAPSNSMVFDGSTLAITSDSAGVAVLVSVDSQDIYVNDSSMYAEQAPGSTGVGFLSSSEGPDYGTMHLDEGSYVEAHAPSGTAIIWKTARLSGDAQVVADGGERGAQIHYLYIGDQSAPSSATITATSPFIALEVLRTTEVYGAGSAIPSIIAVADDSQGGYASFGAIICRPILVNTFVSATATSATQPTTGMQIYDTHNGFDGTPDPDPQAYFEHATLEATGTSAGVQMVSVGEMPFIGCDVLATVKHPTKPAGLTEISAGIVSLNGTYRFSDSIVHASGGQYGWLSNQDDEGMENRATRVYAEDGSDLTLEGERSGIAVNSHIEASGGSTITGIALAVNPLNGGENIPAVHVSQPVPGASEIRADGGTITEVYPTHIGCAIAPSESESFSPYAMSWNLTNPQRYAWSVDTPNVELAADAAGVYTASDTGSGIPNVTVTGTRTAAHAAEPVVVGGSGSAHNVVLLADIGPQAPDTVTVRFEPNGGAPKPVDQTIEKGQRATEPTGAEAPVREGYRFAGWYTDASLSSRWNFASAVQQDMTLYAKWDTTASVPTNPTPTPTQGSNAGKGFAPRTGDPMLDAALTVALFTVACSVIALGAKLHARRRA